MSSYLSNNLLRVRIPANQAAGKAALDEFIKTVSGRDYTQEFSSLCLACLSSPPRDSGWLKASDSSEMWTNTDLAYEASKQWFTENWGTPGIDSSTITGPLNSESSEFRDQVSERWKKPETAWGVPQDGVCWEFSSHYHPPLAWVQTASGTFPELEFFLTYRTTSSSVPASYSGDNQEEQEGYPEDVYFSGSAHFADGICVSWSTNNDELVDSYWPPFGGYMSEWFTHLDSSALYAWCSQHLGDPLGYGTNEISQAALADVEASLAQAMGIAGRLGPLLNARGKALEVKDAAVAIGARLAYLSATAELWIAQAEGEVSALEAQPGAPGASP